MNFRVITLFVFLCNNTCTMALLVDSLTINYVFIIIIDIHIQYISLYI